MTTSLAQIRAGLQTRLLTVAGIHAYAEWPDQIVPPAALIRFDNGEYETAFGPIGDAQVTLNVEVHLALTLKGGLVNAQKMIEQYLDNYAPTSAYAAIAGDRTLGGVVNSVLIHRWRAEDSVEINGQEWMGAIIDAEIMYS